MNSEWTNVKGEKNYYSGIIKLFNDIFKKNIDLNYLRWKYETNPNGESIVQLGIKDEAVIGHLCMMRYKMNLLGDSINAGQTADAMVNPAFRRMGIYEALSKKAFEIGKRDGIGLVFRFPNQAALSASISRQNTKKICDIPQFLNIIEPYAAAGLISSNKIIKIIGALCFYLLKCIKGFRRKKTGNYQLRTVDQFTKEYDQLWQDIKLEYKIAVERKADYLNWRYTKNPAQYFMRSVYDENNLIGYIIAGIEEKKAKDGSSLKMCHIADVLCKKDKKNALGLLFDAVESYAKQKGACAISCWMLKDWFYKDELNKSGYFLFRSPSVLAGLILSDSLKEREDEIINGDNWYVTIGDSDYI